MTEEQVTLAISIGGSLLGVVIGFFLNLWNSNRIEKKHRDNENLRKHFDDIVNSAITQLNSISAGIRINEGLIDTRNHMTFSELDYEQFECFKVHYLYLWNRWQELAGDYIRSQKRTGGKWTKYNDKVDSFNKEVEHMLAERLKEEGLSISIGPWNDQRGVINDNLPRVLSTTLLERVRGFNLFPDFSTATINEKEAKGFYILEVMSGKWANARNLQELEKCKVIFIGIQNSVDLIEEASSLIKEANQIVKEFQELQSNLEKVKSRGLISKDKRYKFKSIEQCPICKELFFTK